MNKILLILQTPPPYGGGEIKALYLKNFFIKNENYIIYDYSRKKNRNRSTQGRFNLINIIFGLRWIINCKKIIRKYKPKKIYFTLPKEFYAFLRNACIISFAKRKGVMVLGELPGASFLFLSREKGIKQKIGLHFLRKVEEIRMLGETIEKNHKKYGLNTIVIDNGAKVKEDVKVRKEAFTNDTLNMLYIGALEFSKGIKNIILAAKLCKEKNLNVKFNIAGEWVYPVQQRECELIIKKNQLNDLIKFHGFVLGNDMWNLFKNNVILVHPTYWDGVPLTILQALAAGMTIISTYVGAIPDIIEDDVNGTLLKKNTPEMLFNAIKKYYSNRHMMLDIFNVNNKVFKKRFDLEIFLKNMKNWYEK